jgi:hypothetical protein
MRERLTVNWLTAAFVKQKDCLSQLHLQITATGHFDLLVVKDFGVRKGLIIIKFITSTQMIVSMWLIAMMNASHTRVVLQDTLEHTDLEP